MAHALSIVVLILVLPTWIVLDRTLAALAHRHRAPKQKQPWYQQAIGLAGIVVLTLLIWPWRSRFGTLWSVDMLLLALGLWNAIVNVLLFGLPDRVQEA